MQPTPPTEKDTGCPQNSQQVIELEKSAVFFMVEAIGAALEFDLTRVQERAPFLEILTPSIKSEISPNRQQSTKCCWIHRRQFLSLSTLA